MVGARTHIKERGSKVAEADCGYLIPFHRQYHSSVIELLFELSAMGSK
jgi:hypothetical protein